MKNQNPSVKSTLKITVSLFLLMFAYALSYTMIGPLLPVIRSEYSITLSQSGLITSFQGIGGAISVILGMIISDLYPKSTIIKIAFVIYGISVLLITFIPYYAIILILFFLLGGSTRLTAANINAYIADIQIEKRSFYLNLLHACFGVGALLGPIFSTVFLSVNLNWKTAFTGLSVICFIVLAVFMLIDKKPAAIERKERTVSLFRVFRLLKNKNILKLCFFSFCYVGFASGISTWIPSYINDEFQIFGFAASYPVVAFWVGVIVGRVVYSFWSQRYNIRYLLFVSNLAAGIIVLAAFLINTYIVLIIGFILAGFFTGAANPMAYSMANQTFPSNKGAVSSALTLFETLGIMIIPWFIGMIAETVTFWTGLVILSIPPVAISILALCVSQKTGTATELD